MFQIKILLFQVVDTSTTFAALLIHILNAETLYEDTPFSTNSSHIYEAYSKNLTNQTIEIDDYVIDKHTAEGRSDGKGAITFVLEGSHVENERILHPEYKEFYTHIAVFREIGEEAYVKWRRNIQRSEKEMYKFLIRAQLNTSKDRPDTYFALDTKGKRVFVKGPYVNEYDAKIPIGLMKIREQLGLDPIKVKMERLIPDSFDSPLGIRNSLPKNKPTLFLIFEDVLEGEELITETKSSKVWPPTQVVDWKKMKNCIFPNDTLIHNENSHAVSYAGKYVKELIFRYVLGVPDQANRNFMYIPQTKKFYGVDLEGTGSVFSHKWNEEHLRSVRKYITKNYSTLKPFIDKFECGEKVKKINTREKLLKEFLLE